MGGANQDRVFYRDQKTKPLLVFGTSEKFAEGTRIPFKAGRYFNGTELQFRANVCVLGYTAYKKLFEDTGFDPVDKIVRVGSQRFQVVGAFDKRASGGGFLNNVDDFVTIPYTTYQRVYGLKAVRMFRTGTTMPVAPASLASLSAASSRLIETASLFASSASSRRPRSPSRPARLLSDMARWGRKASGLAAAS